MSDDIHVVDDDIDLEHDEVVDSRGRRIDAAYVERAVSDVRSRSGRPPLGDEPAGHSPRVSFRLPEQTRRRAEERARDEGRSVSEIAREALERYLAS